MCHVHVYTYRIFFFFLQILFTLDGIHQLRTDSPCISQAVDVKKDLRQLPNPRKNMNTTSEVSTAYITHNLTIGLFRLSVRNKYLKIY